MTTAAFQLRCVIRTLDDHATFIRYLLVWKGPRAADKGVIRKHKQQSKLTIAGPFRWFIYIYIYIFKRHHQSHLQLIASPALLKVLQKKMVDKHMNGKHCLRSPPPKLQLFLVFASSVVLRLFPRHASRRGLLRWVFDWFVKLRDKHVVLPIVNHYCQECMLYHLQ